MNSSHVATTQISVGNLVFSSLIFLWQIYQYTLLNQNQTVFFLLPLRALCAFAVGSKKSQLLFQILICPNQPALTIILPSPLIATALT